MSTTTKIISAVLISGICVGYFFYYQKKNQPPPLNLTDNTAAELKKSAAGFPGNSTNFKGIYLYSLENDSLYLRTVDNKVYNCGKLSDCPSILSDGSTETVYQIKDIVGVYNCAIVPDQYKDKCGGKTTGDIRVILKTASDFEDDLKKKSVGTITPDVNVCYQSSSSTGGDTPFGKTPKSLGEFLDDKKWEIIEFAGQFGVMAAVGHFFGIFGMITMLIPGFLSGDKWGKEKTGFMTGQILGHWMIGKLSEFVATKASQAASKELIAAAEGQIAKVTEKVAVEATVFLSKESLLLLGKVLASAGDMMDGIGELQMLGMFVDVFDFCGLNVVDNNLNQELFDSVKMSSDKLLYIGTSGITYPTIWDPTHNYCDYDLNPLTCDTKYKECPITSPWASPGTPYTKQTADVYCKAANDSIKADISEYLSKLKTNSQGQCIVLLDNKTLGQLFKKYVGGGLDWDSVGLVDANNYPLSLPDNKVLQALDVLLVNRNAIVASYVYQYRYFLLSFMIVLLIIMFLI